jgi:hypothetical protein
MYVASICFKCLFHLDVGKIDLNVAYVCNDYTRMLQVYVPSRSRAFITSKSNLSMQSSTWPPSYVDVAPEAEVTRPREEVACERKKGKASKSIYCVDIILLGCSSWLFGGNAPNTTTQIILQDGALLLTEAVTKSNRLG